MTIRHVLSRNAAACAEKVAGLFLSDELASAFSSLEGCDLDAGRDQGEIGEEGTFPRRPDWFERRREHLQGTAANGDALTNASEPAFTD